MVDGRRGSNVYEVNLWLWQFGRGKPSLGGLSVEETQVRKQAVRDEWLMRAAENRRRSKADRLCMIGLKCGVGKCINVYTAIY